MIETTQEWRARANWKIAFHKAAERYYRYDSVRRRPGEKMGYFALRHGHQRRMSERHERSARRVKQHFMPVYPSEQNKFKAHYLATKLAYKYFER